MRLRLAGLVLALMVARVGWGQINAKAVEKELKGKRVALRSYSAESVARYEWRGDTLVAVPGHEFTLGEFTAKSVKVKGNVLYIQGTRGTLVRDAVKNALVQTGDTTMTLEIDLHNAPTTLQLPEMEKMLFFDDEAKAIAGLAMPLSEILPLNRTSGATVTCNCSRIFDGNQWRTISRSDHEYSFPRLKFSREPEFSEEARQQKVAGEVTLVLYIDNTGHVGDIWIGRALGWGLDEKAVEAARQYVFEPAMYAGKAVGTELDVGINFQIF
jgi:TonB family protein